MEEGAVRAARVLALAESMIPSAELGVHAVFRALAETGACALRTGSSKAPRREDLAWADVVVLVRGAAPLERRILVEAHRLGRRVATYMDDDLERVPVEARSGPFYAAPVVRESVAAIVREADDVLVCSERLAEVLEQRHGRRTALMRQPRPPLTPLQRSAGPTGSARLRIGFFGGVDHAGFVDRLLAMPLRRLCERYRDRVELVFCGARPAIARELGAEQHDFVTDIGAWRAKARGFGVDIGLAPLEDSPFHRCKYWNKYLEYGSLGIAGIYSAVPPLSDAVSDGRTGLLRRNDPDEWLGAMQALVEDAPLREALAAAGRADVEARFSEAALLPSWRRSLAPLLSHRAPPVAARDVRELGGSLRFVQDRLAVYGPLGLVERGLGRITGRLRPG